jgi:hypothetical protein
LEIFIATPRFQTSQTAEALWKRYLLLYEAAKAGSNFDTPQEHKKGRLPAETAGSLGEGRDEFGTNIRLFSFTGVIRGRELQ